MHAIGCLHGLLGWQFKKFAETMRGIPVHKLMCDPYNKQRKSLFFLSGRMFGSVKYVGQSLVEVSVRYPIFFVFPMA